VDQGGGKRNGSFAIYLEPWHADVQSFLKLKSNTGTEEERARDLFYAMWVPDLFMRRVEAGADWSLFCPHEAPGLADVHGAAFDELYTRYEGEGRARSTVPAQKLWSEILVSQIETGTPYLLYKDAANAKSNQKNLGTIKSSNLCVAPETYVLTDKGQFQIHELEGQSVNVWNGETFSTTTVLKTGVAQKLLTVSLSNGSQIHCTPYHKFIVRESYTDKTPLKDATRIAAADLKEGMKLAKHELGIVAGNSDDDIPHPYTHGFFCGDGTVSGVSKVASLYGEKKTLVPHLAIKSMTGVEDAMGRLNCVLDPSIPDKFYVPLNASIKCRLDWFAGLCDADGCVAVNGENESIQVGSIHFEFLDRIRLMLQTLGVQSKVTKAMEARQALLPDGHGGRCLFDCKPLWRLLVSSSGLHRLKTTGFACHRLSFSGLKPQRNAEQFITVVSVVDDERMDDTYCFNEPLNHAGVFNGVLTGNCTEILEYSSPEETAVCNLASIALPHFVNPASKTFDFAVLRSTVGTVVRNLNRVIDINFYPTPETRRSNMRHRPVGLGVQGLADVFALLGLAWETPDAALLNRRIFEHIYYAAVLASTQLADEEGAYETYAGSPASQGLLQPDLWGLAPTDYATATELDWPALRAAVAAHGLRNSLLMAPMPTASTSQILGFNECIEPFTTNIYARRTLAGEFTVVNRYLVADLQAAGLWTPDFKERIIAANGSIQGLPEVPADLKARYKTVWEIKQKTLIDMAADRGAFICQSQSLNLFVQDPTIAKLSSMHFYAWKRGLKTGIYYLRTKSAVQAIKFTIDPRLVASTAAAAATGGAGTASAPEPAECLLCSS
jgi:ribonucleoside-diphosphate reductase alpha chain